MELDAVNLFCGMEKSIEASNTKAMREALSDAHFAILNFLKAKQVWYEHVSLLKTAIDKAKSALAAPPRNCDVGSAVEQNKRFVKYCKGHRIKTIGHADVCNPECPCRKGSDLNLCALAWSQMPYEKGEVK